MAQVEALVLRSGRLLCMLLGREPGREFAKLLRTHHLQFIRGREDPAPPVRALGRVVTFPGNRTVELPDTGSV